MSLVRALYVPPVLLRGSVLSPFIVLLPLACLLRVCQRLAAIAA